MIVKSDRLTILIYSCKKNSDMWTIFCMLFNKYWTDCNYRVILLTDENDETKSSDFDEVVVLDGTWHQMIMAGIEKAQTPYVSLWMDDYLLYDTIDNNIIEQYLDDIDKYNASNIRLTKSTFTRNKLFDRDARYNVCIPGTAYSLSTQVGIWNVECLKRYMRPDWSAWDFERKGSIEIKDLEHPILEIVSYEFPYVEGVRRGKWMRSGIRTCTRNGIELDFCSRHKMSYWDEIVMHLKGVILSLNPDLVQKIQNTLGK